MSQEDFIKKLRIVASRDTSSDPEGWTSNNPLWGHCAVVSLLAQDYFGGDLIRGALDKHPKYASLLSHFWNSLPEGEVDFTAEQYSDLRFGELKKEPRDRERVLSHPDTQRRYLKLKHRFENLEHKT